MSTRTESNERYRSWYGSKGPERNERRREQYAADPTIRKDNRARAKEWRENRAAGASVTREIFREVNGKRTRVYSLGQVADEAAYGVSTLRLLITQGVLPEPTLPGVHRYYTAAEVKKIKAILKKRRA